MLSIRISDLTHEFEEREVLRNIDFSFGGACMVVTGRNGSGKSTLLRIIAGLLTPTEGEVVVTVDGNPVSRDDLRFVTGLVAPDVRLYAELTATENLAFIARARGLASPGIRVDKVLDEVGLAERANDPVGELSTGLRQRACFAAALLHQPRLLLLDEPSSNFDEEGLRMLHSVLEDQRGRGMTIIATNNPAEAELGSVRLDLGGRL